MNVMYAGIYEYSSQISIGCAIVKCTNSGITETAIFGSIGVLCFFVCYRNLKLILFCTNVDNSKLSSLFITQVVF